MAKSNPDQGAPAGNTPSDQVMLEDSPAVLVITVTVAPDCRWDAIQSAGLVWSKTPTEVAVDAPFLSELRGNPLLRVEESYRRA